MSQNLKMDLSSQREDHSRLLDHRPWMTSVQMSLFWFLECTAALRWQIATVSDRVSQKLRCSRLPDKKVPVHSNIGTSAGSDWPGGLPGDSRWAGRPVGRWEGSQQKDYDILFLLAIDVINYDKQNCLSRVIMVKRHRQETVKIIVIFHYISNVTFGHYNSW